MVVDFKNVWQAVGVVCGFDIPKLIGCEVQKFSWNLKNTMSVKRFYACRNNNNNEVKRWNWDFRNVQRILMEVVVTK
jgi:hypothetical protein